MNPCQGCNVVCPGVVECKILFDVQEGIAKNNTHKKKAPPPAVLDILKALKIEIGNGKILLFQSKRIPSKCIVVVCYPNSSPEIFKIERKLEKAICLNFRGNHVTKFTFPTEKGISQIFRTFDK